MKSLLLFSSIILLFSTVHAQEPSINWQNTLGGNNGDEAETIIQTTDGGYVLSGWSSSDVSGDKTEAPIANFEYWVVKVNSSGVKLWDRTLGGDGLDISRSVIATADGGVIVAGNSTSNPSATKSEGSFGARDYWIVKLDAAGNIVWDNTIGASQNDFSWAMTATADGGALLAGDSRSPADNDKSDPQIGEYDYWIVKVDANGDIVWDNTIGGTAFDRLRAVQETADNGFILAGFSNSGISGDKTEPSRGGNDFWVVKTDASGTVVWDKTLGGSGRDEAYAVVQTGDGGYVVGGFSDSDTGGDKSEDNLGQFDSWLVKLDSSGAIVWDNTIGGSFDDFVTSLALDADGSILVGNTSESNISADKNENSNGGFDYWLVNLNQAGQIVNQSTVGGSVNDELVDLIPAAGGGYALLGTSFSDTSGDKNEDGQGINDYWVVKLDNFLSIDDLIVLNDFAISQNPVMDRLEITSSFELDQAQYIIYNVLGQEIFSGLWSNNSSINVADLKSGLYFLKVDLRGNSAVKRFIKN